VAGFEVITEGRVAWRSLGKGLGTLRTSRFEEEADRFASYNLFTIHKKSQNWRLRIWKAVDEAQNVYCQGEFDGWLLLDRRDLRRASELTHLCHPKMTQAGGSLGQGWWRPERP